MKLLGVLHKHNPAAPLPLPCRSLCHTAMLRAQDRMVRALQHKVLKLSGAHAHSNLDGSLSAALMDISAQAEAEYEVLMLEVAASRRAPTASVSSHDEDDGLPFTINHDHFGGSQEETAGAGGSDAGMAVSGLSVADAIRTAGQAPSSGGGSVGSLPRRSGSVAGGGAVAAKHSDVEMSRRRSAPLVGRAGSMASVKGLAEVQAGAPSGPDAGSSKPPGAAAVVAVAASGAASMGTQAGAGEFESSVGGSAAAAAAGAAAGEGAVAATDAQSVTAAAPEVKVGVECGTQTELFIDTHSQGVTEDAEGLHEMRR